MSTLNSDLFRSTRSLRRWSQRRTNRQSALRLRMESLELRRVLATSITGTVVDDLNGNGVVDNGEPGQANVRVYVDANNNDQFDVSGQIIEPDDFANRQAIDGSAAGVSLTVVNSANAVDSEKTIASLSDAVTVTGTQVFGWTDAASNEAPYFSFATRLRADFATPVSRVDLDFAGGNREGATDVGVLEAYDASNTLVSRVETQAKDLGEWETMTVTGASNIAYIIAYTEIPGVLGHLDALRINGGSSEIWTNTHTDGTYELHVPTGGTYRVNEVVPENYEQTLPSGVGSQLIAVSTDATATNVNFANKAASSGAGWQNPVNALDVNNDGNVFAIDALLIINELNEPQYRDPVTGELPTPPAVVPAFFDVDGDGFATATDVIIIINFLNENPLPVAAVSAEGESTSAIGAAVADDSPGLNTDQLVAAAVDSIHRNANVGDELN